MTSSFDVILILPSRKANPAPAPVEKKPEIPDDLICSICKSLFTDAVMIPCCGSSFCDECVRTALLESEDNECPDCHEKGSSPGSLIPNRFLRTSVNSFRNETGYSSRPRQQQPTPVAVPQRQQPQQPMEEKSTPREDFPSPAHHIEEDSQNETMPLPEEKQQRETTPPPPARHADRKQEEESSGDDDSEHSRVEKEDTDDDDEDNITVTVPPAHQQSRTAFSNRLANGRTWGAGGYDRMGGPRSNYPSYVDQGRNTSGQGQERHGEENKDEERQSQQQHQLHRRSSREEVHSSTSHDQRHDQMRPSHQSSGGGPGGDHHSHSGQGHDGGSSRGGGGGVENERYNRPMYNDQQQQGPRGGYDNYHNQNNQNMAQGSNNNNNSSSMNPYHGQRMGYEGNNNNNGGNMNMGPQQHFNRGGGGYMPHRFPNSNPHYGGPVRGGAPAGVGGGMGGGPIRGPNPMNQQLSNIYQGVAAKVGTGIIDDPLEAFNRIMREKELRKAEEEQQRRRSPTDQRRSRERSMERRGRRGSPAPRRSPDGPRMRGGDRRRRSSSYSSSRSR